MGVFYSVAKSAYWALLNALPDEAAIQVNYYRKMRGFLDLRNPRTFNEKTNWRKIHDHDPLMHVYADKLRVKDRVAAILGDEVIIPTLWAGSDAQAIPFDTLEPPYVIKASHGSHMDCFVFKRPSTERRAKIVSDARRWMGLRLYRAYREWSYDEIPPRVMIEPFIGEGRISPQDYRFWCFHGRVEMIQIDTDRRFGVKRAFFDRDWNLLPLKMQHPPLTFFPRPERLVEMISASEKLAAPFSFVRIDLYLLGGRIYFGEATFYPVAGCAAFDPPDMDLKMGELLHLDAAKSGGS